MDSAPPAAAEGRPVAAVVSVWIVNYNSTRWLARGLAGLTSDRIGSIVVLDNASDDGQRTELLALAQDRPGLRVLLSEVNLGFGAGHNHIAAVTRPDSVADELVWLLNPDTVVDDAAVQALCEVLEQGQADLVSPVILTGRPADPVIWFAGGSIDRRGARVAPALVGRHRDAIPAAPLLTSSFLTGAALFLRRSTFERLGGFREELFLYWEDVDLSLRAAELGLRPAVVTAAVIWHAEGGSSRADARSDVGPWSDGGTWPDVGPWPDGGTWPEVGTWPGAGAGSGTQVGSTSRFAAAASTSAAAFYYSARNRILVCAPPRRGLGLVIGRGSPYFVRLAATALLTGGPQRWVKCRAVLQGSLDGLRGRSGDAHR